MPVILLLGAPPPLGDVSVNRHRLCNAGMHAAIAAILLVAGATSIACGAARHTPAGTAVPSGMPLTFGLDLSGGDRIALVLDCASLSGLSSATAYPGLASAAATALARNATACAAVTATDTPSPR